MIESAKQTLGDDHESIAKLRTLLIKAGSANTKDLQFIEKMLGLDGWI